MNGNPAPEGDTRSSELTPAHFLPDFCRNRVVFVLVLLAQLLAIVLALAEPRDLATFWVRLGQLTLFIQWTLLSSVALLCLLRRRLQRLRHPATVTLATYGVTQCVTLALALLGYRLLQILPAGTAAFDGVGELGPFLLRSLIISSIVTLLAMRYFYVQHQWQRQLTAEAEARMLALQARIRPHFLFNSLNTIAQLIRARPEQAEEAVLDLADLFRAALRGRETLTLEQELELTRGYLRLQQLRFGERLRVEWRLADDLPLQAPVPALILQPLVENAVNHGVQPVSGPVTVRIAVDTVREALSGRLLRFEIVNPVEEPPPGGEERATPGAGMALDNVRQRLALARGERARLTAGREGGEFRARLTLPVGG